MLVQAIAQKFVGALGYELVPKPVLSDVLAKRAQILQRRSIDLVIDVGANAGQYGEQLRRDLGYQGRIVSMEPVSQAFSALKAKAAGDNKWSVLNIGLGSAEEIACIHVARNSVSSSLLDMLGTHQQAAPESAYIASENVTIRTLDGVFDEISGAATQIYLKIDTQGFEAKVLAGAERSLKKISIIQLEMSFVPLYAGELLFHELHALLDDKGFHLVAIEPGFVDPHTGRLLQADGIFVRNGPAQ